MKKSTTIRLIAGLLVLGTIGYILAGSSSLPKVPSFSGGSISSHIPASFDQLLHLQMNDDLREVAIESNQAMDGTTFGDVLETIEEVVVYQYVVDDAGYNILFLEGNEGFTIDQVEALGLIAGDENYESIDLGKGYRAYGNKESIDRYTSQKGARISSVQGWNELQKELNTPGMNVGFLSLPIAGDGSNFITAQFAKTLEYTYFVSAIRKENPKGYLALQLAKDTLGDDIEGITPKLLSSLEGKPLVYIEAQDLLGLFAVEKSQLSTVLPLLVSQWGSSQGIAFDNKDVDTLLSTLEKNIAIAAYPSTSSPLQAEIHLLFEDVELYRTISKLGPLLNTTLSAMIGAGNTDLVQEKKDENSLTYTVEMPSIAVGSGATDALSQNVGLLGGSFPLLSFNKNTDYSSVSIFAKDSPTRGSNDLSFDYSENTMVLFGWDAAMMEQTFMKSALQQGGQLLGGDAILQQGSLQGSIDVLQDKQQVRIDFSVE